MTPIDAVLDRIRPETIDAHLRFLSHPLLEGRAPGTRGGDLAAEYVRAQFRRIGLQPVDGSYFQPFDIKGAASDPSYTLERLVLTVTSLREPRNAPD